MPPSPNRFEQAWRATKIVVWARCTRLPRQRKCCSRRRPRPGSPPPPGPERRACGGASIATSAVRIQRTNRWPATIPMSKGKSAAKVDNPAGEPERQPRRRISQRRSKPAAIQGSSGAGQVAVAPEGTSETIDLSTKTTPSRSIAVTIQADPRGCRLSDGQCAQC